MNKYLLFVLNNGDDLTSVADFYMGTASSLEEAEEALDDYIADKAEILNIDNNKLRRYNYLYKDESPSGVACWILEEKFTVEF